MMNEEIKQVLSELGKGFEAFKAEQAGRLDKIETRVNRQALGLGALPATETAAAAVPAEFKAWMRTGERKAMSLGSDPDGGYAAPPEFASQIAFVGAEQGAIRNLARKFTPTTGDFHLPIVTTLAGAGHVVETGTRANTTTPSIAKWFPGGGGLYAVAPVSNWLLNDAAYDIATVVRDSIGQQFGVTESADFVSGDGVSKATGFTTYPLAATADASRPWGTIEKLHAGSTTDFDVDDLLDLQSKLAPRYQKRAAWVMNQATETYVRKLKASTSGIYYWQPSTQAGAPNTLLGLPCYVDVNMPSIASAAAVVALADWTAFYGVADIGQVLVLRDQITSKGNTLFYVEKRVGGGVIDFNAGKLLVMSA